MSESEGEELVRLSEHQALKLINGPDYITNEDYETFDKNEDNVEELDTFDGENYENVTDAAEPSDNKTFEGIDKEMETFDVHDAEKTKTYIGETFENITEFEMPDKKIVIYDVKQESEGNIEIANTLVRDKDDITEEQKNIILVAFKGNEEKAKIFIEANYNIPEEKKNVILDAIRDNIMIEMGTLKKEEFNSSKDISNAIAGNSTESPGDNSNETQANEIPHEFIVNNKIHQQGTKKGESYQTVSLCVFPYMFRKRTTRKEITTFSCNGCEKLKRCVLATARIDENNKWFLLTYSINHFCSPSSTDYQKAEFSRKLYKEITLNPRDSLPKIYADLKNSMTKDMDPDAKKSYLKRISTLKSLQRGLYVYRSQFISSNPDAMKKSDLDKVPKYACDDCKAPFKKKHFLELHMNSVHLNYRPYLCNLCKKSFFIKLQLKIHIAGSHKEKTK